MKKEFLYFFLSFCFVICFTNKQYGQKNIKDSVITMSVLTIEVGFHTPGGDLKDRFGNSSSIGMSYGYKNARNWTFGAEGGFIFGNEVKQDVAINIRTEDGFVLDDNGGFVSLLLLERGFNFALTASKSFPIIGPNPNSGLVVRGGVGMLQHKILLESRENDVNILEGDYVKGFDRLTNGLMLQQFVGYQHMANNRRVNYMVGIEFKQAFTKSRRDYNFDLGRRDDQERFDSLIGLKVGWSLLIYRAAPDKVYYN